MSLRARLDTLRRQAGTDDAPERGGDDALRERLRRLDGGRRRPGAAAGPVPAADVAACVGGEVVADSLVRVRQRIPLESAHGHVALGRVGDAVALPGVGAFPGRSAVFIDTETSGLAGGTGTVAYLGGLARLDGTALALEQYLITAFAGEAAMLAAVRDALGGDDVLVSYNGKSFDAPLLRDRFRLARQYHPLERTGHADLLHPVRRLFRRTWPDCRLATAEARLLGFRRDDDLPGNQAPLVWSELLHGGTTERLPAVLDHNRRDLLSLAALWPVLGEVFAEPARWGACSRAAARAWYMSGDERRARAVLEAAPALDAPGRHELARLRRRAGDWAGARAIWQGLAEAGDAHAAEALAKYHEHVRRDWQGALAWTSRLPAGAEETERRRERLARKRGRDGAQGDLFPR
ncbi:ribonuclease H-like domain-containing protein [Arhodomonas aquaeolei]|uniref:ribonuclease H-like domain-containing protein n=1 Tax=Arhodomonas aquaeolei TaxID=2369 RepID=UPI00216A2F6D|nr:ribonuclease H-like domain-containing protein [Arhodomonas aquaeolei]MCS4505726.1 ribonuclease H-like domain-containing protein [Arhodomonas aquaeolei]